jgi:GNAT superfamily N-acetyltransferase
MNTHHMIVENIVDRIVREVRSSKVAQPKKSSTQGSDVAGQIAAKFKRYMPDGFTVVVNGKKNKNMVFNIIDDETGDVIGGFDRTLKSSGLIHHVGFWIEPKYRGNGLGKIVTDASFKIYKSLGIKGVVVDAQSDPKSSVIPSGANGAYTWARLGFDWFSKNEQQRISADFSTWLFNKLLNDSGVKGSKAQIQWYRDNSKRIDKLSDDATETPRTLADFKLDGVDYGKQFLLTQISWRGVRYL